MRTIKYIVVHCTAGRQNQPTSEIQRMWRGMGWRNPGYHFLISADGTEEQLADISVICNGVAGQNREAIHVSYKGGWDLKRKQGIDNRTDQQKASLLSRLRALKKLFPKAQIVGHRDLSKDLDGDGVVEQHEWIKVCPSFDAKSEYVGL